MIRLQPLNFSKEKINLTHIAALGVPTRLLHRRSGCTKRKRRGKILNVKPHLLPVDDLVTQFVGDVLGFLPLMKLQPGSPDYIYLRIIGMGFQMKEILEQIEVRLNAQESFAKMEM